MSLATLVNNPLTRLLTAHSYMSKAPGKASDYDGSGGWFKIKDWGPTFSGGSASWTLSGMFHLLPFQFRSSVLSRET